ncbi:unnamed protein product, partial [Symbiodinium pilosum]
PAMRWLLPSLLVAIGSPHLQDSHCVADELNNDEESRPLQVALLQRSLVLVSDPVQVDGAVRTTQQPQLASTQADTRRVSLPAWLCSGVLLAVFFILVQEALVAPGLVQPVLSRGTPPQAVFLSIWTCTFAASSVIMPVAFDFAIALGHGAVLSGFLVSAGALGGALGLLAGMSCVEDASWDQSTARRLCVWAGLLTSAIQLVEACVAQSALTGAGGLWTLLALRQGEAFSGAFALAPALAMQRRVYGESGSSTTLVQCSRSLGIAAGPALLLLAPERGLPHALAIAASVSLASAALCSLVLPQKLQHPPAPPVPLKELEMDSGDRKLLVSQMSFFFLVRPFVTAGAEAATMMILEVAYGWSAVTSGLSLSLAASASVLLAPFSMATREGTAEAQVFLTCAVVSLVGCALLFDLKALGAGGLLVGDVLLQSTAGPASAIAERWAKRAATPNSAYSPQKFHLVALGSTSLSRFLAPPLARGLLAAGGRNQYGLVQLALLTCVGYTAVRSCGIWQKVKEPKTPLQ